MKPCTCKCIKSETFSRLSHNRTPLHEHTHTHMYITALICIQLVASASSPGIAKRFSLSLPLSGSASFSITYFDLISFPPAKNVNQAAFSSFNDFLLLLFREKIFFSLFFCSYFTFYAAAVIIIISFVSRQNNRLQ